MKKMTKVREGMGLTNVMIPFSRTVEESVWSLGNGATWAQGGEQGREIYAMCELPSTRRARRRVRRDVRRFFDRLQRYVLEGVLSAKCGLQVRPDFCDRFRRFSSGELARSFLQEGIPYCRSPKLLLVPVSFGSS